MRARRAGLAAKGSGGSLPCRLLATSALPCQFLRCCWRAVHNAFQPASRIVSSGAQAGVVPRSRQLWLTSALRPVSPLCLPPPCRWSWAICTDTCAICRNNLYEPSIEYQANPTGAWGNRQGGARRQQARRRGGRGGRVAPAAKSAAVAAVLCTPAPAAALHCSQPKLSSALLPVPAPLACRRRRPPRPEHRLGHVRARVPPRLHPALAQDALRLPAVQPRVGVQVKRGGRGCGHGGRGGVRLGGGEARGGRRGGG